MLSESCLGIPWGKSYDHTYKNIYFCKGKGREGKKGREVHPKASKIKCFNIFLDHGATTLFVFNALVAKRCGKVSSSEGRPRLALLSIQTITFRAKRGHILFFGTLVMANTFTFAMELFCFIQV